MKKTSIFFLILSVLLIGGGFYLKNEAAKRAEAKGIELFSQEINSVGNLIETVEFPTDSTNRIYINLDEAIINIVGYADKCYAEIMNFNALEYSAYCNNRSFTIENDLISAIVGRAESGVIEFNGVRNFVRFDKYNKTKIVNIYIPATSVIKKIDITLNKGTITVDGLQVMSDFDIKVNDGEFNVVNTPRISLVKTEIKNGNVNLTDTHISNTNVNIENGNLVFSTKSHLIYDYNIQSETGDIKYNEEIHKGTYLVENPEINGDFQAHIGVGNVTITTIAPVVEQPAETPPVTEEAVATQTAA